MCRWMAYGGPEIYLKDVLFEQDNSLVKQSLSARESLWTTNGDGFGVAWYGHQRFPGVFKDILPAWNDSNLLSLAQQIESRLFFAHVRASSGTSVARNNCHPFSVREWCFMHNGQIGGWPVLRQPLEALIDPQLYPHRQGTTDSEVLFLLALTLGLERDPVQAMNLALSSIKELRVRHHINEPLRVSAACSNGQHIWGFRYSSDQHSPSLYYGTPTTHSKEHFPGQINTIASEPIDNEASHWSAVPEHTGVIWHEGRIEHFPITA
jgi:predicted glutamine amidotransferase